MPVATFLITAKHSGMVNSENSGIRCKKGGTDNQPDFVWLVNVG
jgi:hypothetical protein